MNYRKYLLHGNATKAKHYTKKECPVREKFEKNVKNEPLVNPYQLLPLPLNIKIGTHETVR